MSSANETPLVSCPPQLDANNSAGCASVRSAAFEGEARICKQGECSVDISERSPLARYCLPCATDRELSRARSASRKRKAAIKERAEVEAFKLKNKSPCRYITGFVDGAVTTCGHGTDSGHYCEVHNAKVSPIGGAGIGFPRAKLF